MDTLYTHTHTNTHTHEIVHSDISSYNTKLETILENALYLCNGKLFSNKKRTSEKHLKEFMIHAAKWMTFKNILREISEHCSVVFNSLWPHGVYSPWKSPGQDTGVGSLSLLQGIFLTQELNQGLLHCRRILYQLSYYQGNKSNTKD